MAAPMFLAFPVETSSTARRCSSGEHFTTLEAAVTEIWPLMTARRRSLTAGLSSENTRWAWVTRLRLMPRHLGGLALADIA